MVCISRCFYVHLLLQNGKTALMLASEKGRTKCVKALVNRQWGADVDMQDKVSSTKAVRCLLLMCVLVVYMTRESDK